VQPSHLDSGGEIGVMEDPTDPYVFGTTFAEALEQLSDPDTEIDVGEAGQTAELYITVGGVDYVVRITPEGLTEG